jgi:hypothetical protein
MNWGAEFTARFAPIGEWHRVDGIEERFTEAAFENQGLSKYPEARRTIPVVLRHEEDKVAGSVEAVWPMEGWWHARFKLNPQTISACIAADTLKVGTPVSPCFTPVCWRDNGASRQYEQVWLSELSILMYHQRPAYRGAQVSFVVGRDLPGMSKAELDALIERAKSLPPLTEVSATVVRDEYRPRWWDELESIVGYPITDENFERALAKAQRRPIDKLYDDMMAARGHELYAAERAKEGVCVRRNTGRVIGVR